MNRGTAPLDVTIERAPEASLLLRLLGNERVDEDDRVVGLDVHAADLVAPFAEERAPAPQTVSDPLDVHGR